MPKKFQKNKQEGNESREEENNDIREFQKMYRN